MRPDSDHPDTTGSEPPEEPTAARDGNVTKLPIPPAAGAGTPLADRPETETEEEDGQAAFVVEEAGKSVTLAQLLRRGVATEVKYKLEGKAIPNVKGGLLDPFATSVMMIADCVVGDVKHSYIRDGNGKVDKVVQTVSLKPRITHPARSEAGRVLLSGTETEAA
jgi:hypothetical protein